MKFNELMTHPAPSSQSEVLVSQPEFGQRLKAHRLALKMSQRELAGDFVTPSYVSLLEVGSRVPTLDVVVHLSRILGSSVDGLLGRDVFQSQLSAGQRQVLFEPLFARSASDVGDHTQARAFLLRALDAARAEGPQERVLEIGLELQETLRLLGEHQDRRQILEELAALPLVAMTPELQLVVSAELSSAQRDSGQLVEARRTAYDTLGRVTNSAARLTSGYVRLLGVLISELCEAGELDQIDPLITEMLDVAGKFEWPGIQGHAHWVASVAYAQLDRPREAHHHLTQARDTLSFPSMPLADWLRFCRSAATVLMDVNDDLDQALNWVESADAASRMLNLPHDRALVTALRARYQLATGNPREAARLYATLTGADSPLTGLTLIYSCIGYANALRETNQAQEAIASLRKAIQHCEANGSYQLAAQIWRQVDDIRSNA